MGLLLLQKWPAPAPSMQYGSMPAHAFEVGNEQSLVRKI